MNFTREKISDFYLLDTKVENIFINEYMPAAPGDFVKIFLYASMYAEYGIYMDNGTIANQLGVTEERIKEAWSYWEGLGAIKKHFQESLGEYNYAVEFINLKELMYGKATLRNDAEGDTAGEFSGGEEESLGNEILRDVFVSAEKRLGRGLSATEIELISTWVTELEASPELIDYAISYCSSKGKTAIRYIDTVLKGWINEDLRTGSDVENHLNENDQRYYRYKRVLKALGFTRNATEAERIIIDQWFEKTGCSMDEVLEACSKTSGISNPNINYVNKVINNKHGGEQRHCDNKEGSSGVVSMSVLNEYYDFLRAKAERESEKRKEEVYVKLPRIKEIDGEIKELSSRLSKVLILGAGGNSEGIGINETMDKLTCERAVIMTENDYQVDYTDIKYQCSKCNDTGITDAGEHCTCIKQRTEEAKQWQKRKPEDIK